MPSHSLDIALRINGEAVVVRAPLSVSDLLAARNLLDKRVAVERNGAIVPRSRHADTWLNDFDHVEIIIAVGGG
jgi:sulfur carrier protein